MVFEEAGRNNAKKIGSLRMKVGAMSGVVPEALEFAFQALTEGTIAEGARLLIDKVPIVCYCKKCRLEFEPEPYSYVCPSCHEASIEIRRGRELEIVSIEVS